MNLTTSTSEGAEHKHEMSQDNKRHSEVQEFNCSLYSMKAVALYKKNEYVYVHIHRKLKLIHKQNFLLDSCANAFRQLSLRTAMKQCSVIGA